MSSINSLNIQFTFKIVLPKNVYYTIGTICRKSCIKRKKSELNG